MFLHSSCLRPSPPISFQASPHRSRSVHGPCTHEPDPRPSHPPSHGRPPGLCRPDTRPSATRPTSCSRRDGAIHRCGSLCSSVVSGCGMNGRTYVISMLRAPCCLNPRRFRSSSARWMHCFRMRSSVEYSVSGVRATEQEDAARHERSSLVAHIWMRSLQDSMIKVVGGCG